MAQLIEVPGMGQVEFPDGMSDAEIAKAIQSNLRQDPPKESPGLLSEAGKVIGSSLYEGVTGLPRLVMEGGNALEEAFPTPSWSKIPIPGYDAVAKADEALRETLTPETETGQSLARIGGIAAGAFMGPGVLQAPVKAAAIGLGSGIGAEAGHQLSPDNPLLSAAGALAGGALPAYLAGRVPNSKELIREATRFVAPADFRRAGKLQGTLRAEGVPHLPTQLLGQSSTLPDLVEVMAAHPETRARILNAVKGTDAAAQASVDRWMLENLPPNPSGMREVLRDAQEAATAKLRGLRQEANQRYAEALPPGVASQEVSPEALEDVVGQLQALARDPNYGGRTSGMSAMLEDRARTLKALGEAEDPLTLGELEGVNKWLRQPAQQEGLGAVGTSAVKDIIRNATPEYDAARAAKQAFVKEQIEPFQQGLAGDLVRMGGGVKADRQTAKESILRTFFPERHAQPAELRKAVQDLGPDSVGDILRLHLADRLAATIKLAPSGAASQQVRQPYDFVRAVAGNRAQRQNLQAALGAVAKANGQNPGAVNHGFFRVLRALATTKDLKLPDRLDLASLQQKAGQNFLGLVVAPNSRIGRLTWEKTSAKAYRQIADIILSPDALPQLERIGRSSGFSEARAFARSVLLSTLQSEDDGD